MSRWALTNYVTDLGVAPELSYDSWNYHAVFSSLNSQAGNAFPKAYPLTPPTSSGRAVNLTGTLRAGSGIYQLATQPSADPGFTLSFTAPSGSVINAALVPRLNVIRLQ